MSGVFEEGLVHAPSTVGERYSPLFFASQDSRQRPMGLGQVSLGSDLSDRGQSSAHLIIDVFFKNWWRQRFAQVFPPPPAS